MKDLFFLFLGLIIIFGSIFLFIKQNSTDFNETRLIKINDVNIALEIANTPEMITKGLSGRATLPEGTGMLFIFEEPALYNFWMKDMNFPIDIVWIDEDWKVVGIERDIAPETFPETFSPNQAVKYVLEFPAGSALKYRIDIGAVIQ